MHFLSYALHQLKVFFPEIRLSFHLNYSLLSKFFFSFLLFFLIQYLTFCFPICSFNSSLVGDTFRFPWFVDEVESEQFDSILSPALSFLSMVVDNFALSEDDQEN